MTKTLQEAAYVAIGFGVLGFQRAQVRRRQLADQLQRQRPEMEAQLAEVRTQVTELGRDLERRLQPALVDATERVEPLLDQIEARVSEQAKDVAQALLERYRSTG